ncbi:translation elongation factor Ts, partial [Bacteroidota bacterium]|nr:translation elongation factor Ts [Bacteroidota bacterium]
MSKITASEVNKLRKQTGAGMMDCKNALVESKGVFDKAIDILRKKGQKIAAKRADRSASEGVVISSVNSARNLGIIVSLNCETDFVAKNEDFIKLANSILELSIKNETTTLDELNSLEFTNGKSVEDNIIEQTGVIGEKLELSLKSIKAEFVSCYIHAGSRLASMVGFDKKLGEN